MKNLFTLSSILNGVQNVTSLMAYNLRNKWISVYLDFIIFDRVQIRSNATRVVKYDSRRW